MSLLTAAEVAGVATYTPPLTNNDVRTIVARAYSRGRAEAALAGHPHGRGSDWGGAGRDNGVWVSTHSDRYGIWALIKDATGERGGHIRWARAEAVLRELYPAGQLGLFDAEVR